MLSPFSWERIYYQYYQISKALYVSVLKTGYKLKIKNSKSGYFPPRLVYYWSHITMVPEVSYHTQKFGIAELRYISLKRGNPTTVYMQENFAPSLIKLYKQSLKSPIQIYQFKKVKNISLRST